MSVDYTAIHRALRAWVVGGSGLPLSSVYWGQQDSKRVAEPAIELRIYATHPIGLPWLDVETNFVDFAPLVVESVVVLDNAFAAPSHGFGTGDGPLRASSSGTLPTGLSSVTDYWVIAVTSDTFRLASSYTNTGGADINGAPSGNDVSPVVITSAGSGALTLTGTSTSTRAGEPVRYVSRAIERLQLIMECHTSDAVGMQAAMSLLSRVKARQRLPSQQAILAAGNIGLSYVERARALHGVRNAVMFEPRASMEALFALPTEEVEYGQSIERLGPLTGTVTR